MRSGAPPRRLEDAPNLNRFWADLVVEELVRQGVGLFCLAPGSRSGPLATAVAAHPSVEHLIHYDERGTAFAALGWARATGRPACWITTSGSAVANGFPAIVEAASDGVPLIALTADRPPELRHTGANQTIDQPGIFGTYARWSVDLPVPDATVDPAYVLTTVGQAVHRATSPRGPVHVNMMFREPLAPDVAGARRPVLPRRWRRGRAPFTSYCSLERSGGPQLHEIEGLVSVARRGLVVAGRMRTRAEGSAVAELARRLGWPLIADACSQVEPSPQRVRHADLVLASDGFVRTFRPDLVLQIGGRLTSKRVTQYLAASEPRHYVVLRDDPFRLDPYHAVSHRIEGDVVAACEALGSESSPHGDPDWLAAWRSASTSVAEAIDHVLRAEDGLTEPGVASLVAANSPGRALVIGSSMPIRDVDAFGTIHPDVAIVAANRGASGIDGTIATAAGVARGTGVPVSVLLGDMALLHDMNSLALLRRPDQPPVVIVVVNNDGCGIFHFLPIAEHADVFEPFFGTPHGMSFGPLADQFALRYESPDSPEDFGAVYQEACETGQSILIEVRTDREVNLELHRRLEHAAARAIATGLEEQHVQ